MSARAAASRAINAVFALPFTAGAVQRGPKLSRSIVFLLATALISTSIPALRGESVAIAAAGDPFRFIYDQSGRLVAAVTPTDTAIYAYDAVGNLREQLAIEEAASNPGGGTIVRITMKDPRWPASQGWVKMQQIIRPGGEPINVHYVLNKLTGWADDFKIKLPGP